MLKFCQEVCKRVVPLSLWGSSSNRRTFLSNLFRFISLRKGENMALRNIMNGIKTSDCGFIRPDNRIGKRSNLIESSRCNAFLAKFYLWLMNSYFVPLLRGAFTISESPPRRNHMSYFRKHVWKNAQEDVVFQMRASSTIAPLPDDEARQLISSGQSLGYAPLRFIPKSR